MCWARQKGYAFAMKRASLRKRLTLATDRKLPVDLEALGGSAAESEMSESQDPIVCFLVVRLLISG